MDSLTQMALGAALGEATLGRKLGNKAMVIGAVLGTLPDLDVIVPYTDAVANFTFHRSFSHSFLVLTLLTPLLAWIGYRSSGKRFGQAWFWCVLLVLNTHVLLDCFTVYGTQAFWPISEYPIAWATIFIIDPLYTLPLLISLIIIMRAAPKSRRRAIANIAGLVLSTTYLAWTVVAQNIAHNVALNALQAQSQGYTSAVTTPAPLSLLWRTVARDEDGYAEGYYSLLDGSEQMNFDYYRSDESLFDALQDHWPAQRLKWFTRGFYTIRKIGDDIVMTDLRMGVEASYVFNFLVGKDINGEIQPVLSELRQFAPDTTRLGDVFRRQFDSSISLAPRPPTVNTNH
ncbi:MAG: metal-dependent hydrolase [Granulosicoccus sp.]|nr:metal-dependent hydrolase [Granulosicoccus sp.]